MAGKIQVVGSATDDLEAKIEQRLKKLHEEEQEAAAQAEEIVPAVRLGEFSDDEEEKRIKKRKTIITVIKITATNTCLFFLVVGYCALGGIIFNKLEAQNEIETCTNSRDYYKVALDKQVEKIVLLSGNLQLSESEMNAAFSEAMDDFRIEFQKSGWDIRHCEAMEPKWNWMGAFFFSLTVVSTIGYGHIAPKTDNGKIVVMFYAVVGLPLMLMTLASVGSVMANMFKWLYNMVCCCGCCVKSRQNRQKLKPPAIFWRVDKDGKPIGEGPSVLAEDSDSEEAQTFEQDDTVNIPLSVSLMVIALSLVLGAMLYIYFENWSFLDATYFSFISLSTIGLGDKVPKFSDDTGMYFYGKAVATWMYLGFGMALVSMCLQMMQDEVSEKIKWLMYRLQQDKEKLRLQQMQNELSQRKKMKDDIKSGFHSDDDNNKNYEKRRQSVLSKPGGNYQKMGEFSDINQRPVSRYTSSISFRNRQGNTRPKSGRQFQDPSISQNQVGPIGFQ